MSYCICQCGRTEYIRNDNLLKGRSNGCSRCSRTEKPNEYEFLGNTVRVQCASGRPFIIDAADFELVSQHQWAGSAAGGRYYSALIEGRRVLLHRLIMGVDDLRTRGSVSVDHISGDCSDNRRENLRLCMHRENMKNLKLSTANTSGYKGVSWHPKAGKFLAQISTDGAYRYLGLHKTAKEAAAAYDRAALLLHGQFAKTNKMLGLL